MEALDSNRRCLQNSPVITIAGQLYQVSATGSVEELINVFEEEDEGASIVRRNRLEEIRWFVQRFGDFRASESSSGGASGAENTANPAQLDPQPVTMVPAKTVPSTRRIPAARVLRSALSQGRRGGSQKHVRFHFGEDQRHRSERSESEHIYKARQRLGRYCAKATSSTQAVRTSAASITLLAALIEAKAMAATEGSDTETIEALAAAQAAFAPLLGQANEMNVVAARAQEAVERAGALAGRYRTLKLDTLLSDVSQQLKAAIGKAMRAYSVARWAQSRVNHALLQARAIAASVGVKERNQDTRVEYFGGATAGDSDSDDDLTELESNFDRASLE